MKSSPFKRIIDNHMHGYGDIDLKKKIIRVNKKRNKKAGRGELLDTMIHEELHRKFPKAKEKRIYSLSTPALKKLTATRKRRLMSKYHI